MSPKVVLLGKCQSDGANAIYETLTNMEPSHIPTEFLDTVYVTMASGEKFKVAKQHYREGLDYENVEKYLLQIGIPDDFTLIEIVLNLEVADKVITAETATFLGRYFSD